ncbi:MAG: hypothetical protein E7643_08375 [Ruminococcaceae bacterium]|nr:hypothetical protein [Oscillospiraceae bacterium]
MKVIKILASSVTALDSNVYTGGGTDATEALQKILDMANSDDVGVHLIMDGAALISQLKLYSNTTIECLNKDCGFYQIEHTDDAMITNAVWDHYDPKTRNISLLGGTYNQNCKNQAHDHGRAPAFYEAPDGRAIKEFECTLCIVFYGVKDLLVRDVTIAEFRTFAFTVGCFKNVTVENVWLDMRHHMNGNQDGFHFWGPGQYLTVKNCGGSVSDDIMNIGPDEMDEISDITDVLVDGIFCDDAEQAIRLLSRGTGRLDRVTIRNVTGQYRSFGFYINPWFTNSKGDFGNIFIENIDLKEHKPTYSYYGPILFCVGGNVECLTLKNVRHHNSYDDRRLIDIGLPYCKSFNKKLDESSPEHALRMQTIIIDGLTITENEKDPIGKTYIKIHENIENLILKNVFVLKNQDTKNGTFLEFAEMGHIDNLITESIYIKGVETVCSNYDRIGNKIHSKNDL